ncbi:MAG: hypothetical protein AAGE65_06790 [Planctomycetota bacterium]
MTIAPEVVMSESAPAGVAVSYGKPARRLSTQPLALTAAAHAALFIAGALWMMSHDYITVAHRLYLALLGSGLMAWVGLLAVGSAVWALRGLSGWIARAASRADVRPVGRLAGA